MGLALVVQILDIVAIEFLRLFFIVSGVYMTVLFYRRLTNV